MTAMVSRGVGEAERGGVEAARRPEARAAASGSLLERPVPRLLFQLLRKRVTGILDITDDSGDRSRVFLRDGAAVQAERPDDLDHLVRVMTDLGLPEAARLAELLPAAGEPEDAGLPARLLEQGLIAPARLAELLRQQLRRKLQRLFFVRKGRFEVFLEPHVYGLPEAPCPVRLDPRVLMLSGIRAAYDEGRLLEELAPLAGRAFRLAEVPAGLLDGMGFPRSDAALARLQGGLVTLAELTTGLGKATEVRSLVLALLYADLIQLGEARAVAGPVARAPSPAEAPAQASPPGAPPTSERTGSLPDLAQALAGMPGIDPAAFAAALSAAVAAPPPPAPGPASQARPVSASGIASVAVERGTELRGRLLEIDKRLATASHFELLEIDEQASSAQVSAAYLRAVRQFHPDRLAGVGLRELAPLAERVVGRLGEAQAVLLDPRRRAAYLSGRAGTAPAPDAGQAILAAEDHFAKAEAALRRGDHAHAIESFALAIKVNPLEPAYRAHWAWARFDAPGANRDALARETLQSIEAVLKERPRFPMGHYWLALLHKHLGDVAATERCLREALAQNKNLLEAERELRLLEMRKAKAAAAQAAARAAGKPLPASSTALPRQTASAAKPGLLERLLKR
jgi:curved DNA-binding protein CbpA